MGSKKKLGLGKKKKKNTKTSDGSKLAAAIMPSAMMAAVPRTPPAPRTDKLPEDLQTSSGILSHSLLPRMFTQTRQPEDEQNTEETDTSLYDYENARQTMHSTYGTGSDSQDFSSAIIHRPPREFEDDTDDSETEIGRTPSPHHSRQSPVSEPKILKGIQKQSYQSRSISPSTTRNSVTFTDTGTWGPNSTMHTTMGTHSGKVGAGTSGSGQRGARRTPSMSSVEAAIEEQMIVPTRSESSLQSSLDKSLTRVSTGPRVTFSKDLSPMGSIRMTTLKEQNTSLAQKQVQLEEQLVAQKQLQEQLMSKLREQGLLLTQSANDDGESTQDVGSLLQETCSITDQTNEKQTEVLSTLKERIVVVENEKKELEHMNEQLRTEIISLHNLASARGEDGDNLLENHHLKKLKTERDTLQTMVTRLNAELDRYHTKFRGLTPEEYDNTPGIPFSGPKPSWLIQTKYLAPLLLAYDDKLAERANKIKDMEKELDTVYAEVEDVLRENQKMRIRIEGSGTGDSVGLTEWQSLQEQCKLVLEENQYMMEQLDVERAKAKEAATQHVQEVSKLSKRIVIAEAERNQLEREVADVRDQMALVRREHTQVVIESKTKLGTDEHIHGVNKFKLMLEEEKTNHATEMENMMLKVQNLATERKSLSLQVEELKADNQTAQAEIKVLQKAQKKAQKKVKILQQALEEAEVKEQTAERYLSSIIKVAERTAEERDTFVEKAELELRHKKMAINKVMEGNVEKNKMEEKLKMVKCKASEKLEKAASRMKEQDNDFGAQRHEYEREIKHLRLMLRERDEMLGMAAGEKKRVEDDLETMWQVATADNQRIRDTLTKSLRNLELRKLTTGKTVTSGGHGDLDLLLCHSDTES